MRRKPRRDLLDLSIVAPAARAYNSLSFFFSRVDLSLSFLFFSLSAVFESWIKRAVTAINPGYSLYAPSNNRRPFLRSVTSGRFGNQSRPKDDFSQSRFCDRSEKEKWFREKHDDYYYYGWIIIYANVFQMWENGGWCKCCCFLQS